jgi:hypothetical protein
MTIDRQQLLVGCKSRSNRAKEAVTKPPNSPDVPFTSQIAYSQPYFFMKMCLCLQGLSLSDDSKALN